MNRSKIQIFTALAILTATTAHAGWKDIPVSVMVAPKYDLTAIKRIAVVPFRSTTGRYGEAVTSALSARLMAGKTFDLLDRSEMSRVLDEAKLAEMGVTDAQGATQMGKMLNVDALVFGKIDDASRVYDEEMTTQITKYRAGDGVQYNEACPVVVRHANLGISFQVVKVETGQILALEHSSKQIDQKHIVDPNPKNSWIKPGTSAIAAAFLPNPFQGSVELAPTEELQQVLSEAAATEFANMLVPHKENIVIKWDTVVGADGDAALNLLRAEMVRDAQEMMESKVSAFEQKYAKNAHNMSAMYYDCGVLHEVAGELDLAKDWYKKAVLANPGGLDDRIREASGRINARIEDVKRQQDMGIAH
jgi:hypothetical protein